MFQTSQKIKDKCSSSIDLTVANKENICSNKIVEESEIKVLQDTISVLTLIVMIPNHLFVFGVDS